MYQCKFINETTITRSAAAACVSLGTSIYPLLRYHCKITYVTIEKSIEGHDADPFQVY